MTDEELHRHLVGRPGSRAALNTPALVVDRDALDRNIDAMAAFAKANGLALRPHAKTHKSADIAARQIAAGAVGICCAKLGEAEALAAGGIAGILITSPVVSAAGAARVAALNGRTQGLMCTADNPQAVRTLGAAVAAAGGTLPIVIDVDPGIHRTGVAGPAAAVALLAAIEAEPALAYAGVQFYCGTQQHIADYADRAAAMHARAADLRAVIAALTAAGGKPPIVTGGGTGTHRIDATLGLFTELQVGSYVFMDDQYRACALTADPATQPFATALAVDACVISCNTPGIATVDAGYKAFATDADPPSILDGAPAGTRFAFMGDEHGALIGAAGGLPGLGGRVSLAAPHCDPTVNLYDTYHVVSGDTLVDMWPVTARGRSR